jgi:ribose transport system permease protein
VDPYRGVIALFIVFLAGIWFSPINPDTGENVFLRPDVQVNLFRFIAEFGILAVGMTFVILTGGIDLSVGSVLAFSAMTFTYLLIREQWPATLAVAGGLGIGLGCGILSGLIISRFKLQPFVVTLAMMVFARGAARWISNSEKIQTDLRELPGGVTVRDVPPIFTSWGGRLWPTAPIPLLNQVFVVTSVFIALVLVGHLVLSKTSFGRYVYSIGGNEEAAKYSGLRVGLSKSAAYGICGLLAGVAGIFNAAQVGMGDPSAGLYRELDAIAAVVIGGTSLNGGRGSVLLTLLGVLIIGYIDTILSINNVADPWRLMSKGIIIVVAVLIQQRR